MAQRTKYNIQQLRDYSSCFLRNEVGRWYNNDFSSLRIKIDRYDSIQFEKGGTYLNYLKRVYRILERYYPNQYVYKNEFIKQWLLKEIGLADSLVFSEFRIGKAVADLTMVNGVSRVFEIKTLLDKTTRLTNQLEQYQKLFNEIYLVIPAVKIDAYLKWDPSIGIIAYEQSTASFKLVRTPIQRIDIDVHSLMQVLHTHEYLGIVMQHFEKLPKMNAFNKFQICKQMIEQLPKETLNQEFLKAMKTRKIHNAFSLQDAQLNQVCLAMNYSPLQKRQLLNNLNTTIS